MMFQKVRRRRMVLLYSFALASCAAAQVSAQTTAPGVYAMSAGRLAASLASLVGLTGVIIGGQALARSTRHLETSNGRRRALVAMLAGLAGVVVGALVVATSAGGIGTGHGVAGAWLAMVLGLVSMLVAGLALARSRRE